MRRLLEYGRGVALCLTLALAGGATGALAQTAQPPLRADLGPPWRAPNGQVNWPLHAGCANNPAAETLRPGVEIDRYGNEGGRFFAPLGTPWRDRALPYDPAGTAYRIYVIRQPLTVEACRTAAWFGEPGGGLQFETSESAAQLSRAGLILLEGQSIP